MTMINAYDPASSGHLPAHEQEMIARRRRLLGPAYRLFYAEPVHVVRGEGVWLYDPEGRAYLDVYNNVASVGHCHPHVVAALSRQAAILNTHTRYLHESVLDYAERLLGYFPAELGHVMFTCTGSEANDLALRVAKAHTGGTGVIVTRNAYHGVTSAHRRDVALARFVDDPWRPRPHGSGARCLPRTSGDVGAAFADMCVRRSPTCAQTASSRRPCWSTRSFPATASSRIQAGFLQEAVAEMRKAGALFIADEVQPGFGRTGGHMWGFQRHGLVPDIVTLGKPMGNGHPIAGMVARPEVLKEFGEADALFQHLRRQPRFGGGRHGGSRRHRARRSCGECRKNRRLSGAMDSKVWRTSHRSSETSAPPGFSSAWSLFAIGERESLLPRRRLASSTGCALAMC